MAKFYVMGNYSSQAFQGFVKDPGQDRGKAVEAISQAMGGKVHSFDICLLYTSPSPRDP